MSRAILLRWKKDGKEICIVLNRRDMGKEISSLLQEQENISNPIANDLKDIVQNAESIYWDAVAACECAENPVVLEYWYADGNTSTYTIKPEEKNELIQRMLEVIFKQMEHPLKKEIPEKVKFTWLIKGCKKEKNLSKLELIDIFSPYIYTDAMNNGIAKKITSIVPYSLSWYINWDNDAEINSLFYEYGEEGFKKSISIPGIHRKIWGEFKKLCDIEN